MNFAHVNLVQGETQSKSNNHVPSVLSQRFVSTRTPAAAGHQAEGCQLISSSGSILS